MNYTCYSELCEVHEECNCGSDCCKGVKTKPLSIMYVNDNLVITNTNIKTTDSKLIWGLVVRFECPFCVGYVEA